MPTVKEYAQAIRDANGLITVAARRLGVARNSIYKAAKRSALVRQALEDSRERTTDLAEGKLYEQINEGNTTAIIFYLKTQGKKRGYIERQERHHSGKIDVGKVAEMSDDELEELAGDIGLGDSGSG